jgi:hypothetical protein
MIDVGKDIKRNNKKTVMLAEKIAKSDFMNGWLIDNQQNFIETMNLIKEGAPVKWAELYMRAYQLGIVKETNVNININREKDREDLQALVRTKIQLPDTGTYTPYEEVKPQPIPLKRKEEEF